ncbi:histidine kinase, partial [Streptomyces sp. PKU-EA00015]|nr:histidine kinase [Streptomyces sp. PKU-EA00015]
ADAPAGPGARAAAPGWQSAGVRDQRPAPPAAVRPLRPRDVPTPSAEGELPRRVRQSHLAPQLRQAPQADPPHAAGPPADGSPDRSPDVVRERMNAYRNGWARGGGAAPGSSHPDATEPPRPREPEPSRDRGQDRAFVRDRDPGIFPAGDPRPGRHPHPGRQPHPGSEGDRA